MGDLTEISPSIELRGVRKAFGETTAVDGISLRVAPGEFLTLLGPSGCGKTTTLRMIGGFELPSAGQVLIGGVDMGDRPPYRRDVNTVFQNYALFPHLSVAQNVAFGLEMTGVPKAERARRVGDALAMVRLPGVERRRPGQLSGGQQQRVALARALVNRPAVLLLDEPLGALDLKLRESMQLELKALNRETGATFVYVTHDQAEALTMSDRIAVMRDGRILQLGTPDEIYERPRSRFVADFIGQTNFLEGTAVLPAGDFVALEVRGVGVLRGRAATDDAPSGRATLAVRPEKVTFAQPDDVPAGWNAVEGTLADAVYLGTHTRFVVRLPGGGTVAVHRLNTLTGEPNPTTGTAVRLAFDPDAATVLPD